MNDAISVETIDRGVVDGLQTVEVIDVETGETIGYNQTPIDQPPLPVDSARQSAMAKLAKLGLTPEEIEALTNL
jgi:RecB family exonuclease